MPAGGAVVNQDQWDEYKKYSKRWAIRMSYEMLHSAAYRELNYGPALKVLNWFHEKIKISIDKKKRGKDRYTINDGSISFTYSEAAFRGISSQQFRKALKELHRFGFINIEKPGSGLKGDWTIFAMSDRWRNFGSTLFNEIEFPRSIYWQNFGPFKKKS